MLFSVLRQSIFILSNTLKKFKDNNVNALSRDGFISLKNFFPSNYCDDFLKKYYIDEVAEENYISKYKTITKSELEYIINTLKQKGIIDIIKEYLGKKIICYDNSILFLGNKTSEKESWMPHHDNKENRLKLYIFLVSSDNKNQPLDYLVGSHKKIKTWKNSFECRLNNYTNNMNVQTIYNNKGDLLIFDTHGFHSNKKFSKNFRATIVLTFESIGFFKRINYFLPSGKREIERLKKTSEDNFIYL